MREMNFDMLEQIVKADNKSRYNLIHEPDKAVGSPSQIWWIRANQGHSMKTVVLDLQPIQSPADIPTGLAVHGTSRKAWDIICEQGLSKMSRNHIHLAQGVPGSGVISGMRSSSSILIFVDIQKALAAGIRFYLSDNGVVLTDGDEKGFLSPQFFARVETAKREPLPGWEGAGPIQLLNQDKVDVEQVEQEIEVPKGSSSQPSSSERKVEKTETLLL